MSQTFKKLVPSLNRLLIKRADPIKKSASGIILSENKNPNIGEVLAVGPGHFDEKGNRLPLSFKVGDTVLLPDFQGTKVELSDGEFFLYRDTDILGVLHK